MNLYKLEVKQIVNNQLTDTEKLSVFYHNIFGYPLNFADIVKWTINESIKTTLHYPNISSSRGFYFIEGGESLPYKRVLKNRISDRKIKSAKKAAKVLSLIPSVRMVGVTGSLAMNNAGEDSDIDLMIITSKGSLWTTRLISYGVTWLLGVKKRKAGLKTEKDLLCLNMWLDESNLIWAKNDRNLYTAHEIAQVVPLVNKERAYEKFLWENKWILNFWPNSVKIRNPTAKLRYNNEIRNKFQYSDFKYLYIVWDFVLRASNFIAFKLQYQYMRSKITRELITPTRALFHPQDWGSYVLQKLGLV